MNAGEGKRTNIKSWRDGTPQRIQLEALCTSVCGKQSATDMLRHSKVTHVYLFKVTVVTFQNGVMLCSNA
jgi:hypothetical protein